jgi:hypothetical protein
LNDAKSRYVYSEIKKDYDLSKRNITVNFTISNSNIIEALYVNYKGDGHTFFEEDDEFIEFNFINFRNDLEKMDSKINLYKIKYKRNIQDEYLISQNMYNNMLDYISKDCKNETYNNYYNEDFILKNLYLETNNEDIIDKYIDDKFIKLIFNIETIRNLRNIDYFISKYNDKIIYKLPMFNWKDIDLLEFYKKLENKEVMFTRLSQIYSTRNIHFKKKYTDYTVYVWNKETLKYLKKNGIEEFSGSPELNYNLNKKIFGDTKFQMVIAGKMPLVYTRGCFGHILGCQSCLSSQQKYKEIKNEDKNLLFDIVCKDDYRTLFYKYPILNDYKKVEVVKNTEFRYIVSNENLDDLEKIIKIMKEKDFYNKLKKEKFFEKSYECNLIESRN